MLLGTGLVVIAGFVWFASGPRPAPRDEPPKALPAASQVTDVVRSDADPKAAATALPRPANWVAAAPAPTGATGAGSLQYASGGVQGTIERLSGAVEIRNISKPAYRGGADARLELSVASGAARAYLQYFPDTGGLFRHQDGFVFAQAEPGKPAVVEGLLGWGGGSGATETFALTLESVAGDAAGLRYTITPRR
jgi:hypothetical protein